MDKHQRELRDAAEKEFLEALNQLQESLKSSDAAAGSSPSPPQEPPSRLELPPPPAPHPRDRPLRPAPTFDLADFEAAAKDIEEFIASHPTPIDPEAL